jgi:hypothetical protein
MQVAAFLIRTRGAIMKYHVLTWASICLLLAANLYTRNATQTGKLQTCSEGWYITGYYVPREDELPDTSEQIDVERVGTLSFSQ